MSLWPVYVGAALLVLSPWIVDALERRRKP